MPMRCLVYAARLKAHLLKARCGGPTAIRTHATTVGAHRAGCLVPAQTVVAHTGIGDLWDTSHAMPMLDIGVYQDAEWSALPLTTETEAFIGLTLLHGT